MTTELFLSSKRFKIEKRKAFPLKITFRVPSVCLGNRKLF